MVVGTEVVRPQYEDYNTVSKVYDRTRTPVGVEDIKSALADSPFAGEHHILDVACGTGNYTIPVSKICASVQCVELNEGMIAQLKQKIEKGGLTNIEVQKGFAQDLPFPDETFTAVTCTMALHHFGDEGISKFVQEAARVVKKGGQVIINHCEPDQLQTYWYLKFLPVAFENMHARLVSNERLCEMAVGTELTKKIAYLHKETLIRLEDFTDPVFMVSEEGRNQISDWALSPKQEVQKAVEDVTKLAEEGKFQDWYKENCQPLLDVHGQASTLVFTKA